LLLVQALPVQRCLWKGFASSAFGVNHAVLLQLDMKILDFLQVIGFAADNRSAIH
jgi:hypothetical protein